MPERDRRLVYCDAIVLAVAFAMPAFAAEWQFQGEFDPFPHETSTRDTVVGSGVVSATLSGNTLAITGNFSGLSSNATAAHLQMGAAMGVPGPRLGELMVTNAGAGRISGTIKLDTAAIAALNRGALYVELDSIKAPDGNSWAWLEAQQAGTP